MLVWGGNHDAFLNTGGRYALGHSIDHDSDGYSECDGDCNDDDGEVFPGAFEINDGVDNQCPGYSGSGMVDELLPTTGFWNPDDKDEYFWEAQAGATSYRAARSTTPDFSAECLLSPVSGDTSWVDEERPVSGVVFYYLVRAFAPNKGSWGQDSSGQERDVCP
jgi:hypothetical protein